jgi:hypothetical protein
MRKLTGRFDFRRTLFGNQVLVVEEDVPNFWPMSRKQLFRRRWRRVRLPRDLKRPEGFIPTCQPTLAKAAPSGPEWLHEIKHDGYRLIALRR